LLLVQPVLLLLVQVLLVQAMRNKQLRVP